MEDDRKWASPDSLEGLLQRGRGEGHRRALREPQDAGEIIIRCVIEDPRWDRQVEDRSLFYARLIRELDLDLSVLEAHLFDGSDFETKDEYRTGLTIYTLADLASYGHAGARELLRRYAAEGWNWEWALQALVWRVPDAVEGLGAAMVSRFGDVNALLDQVGGHTLLRDEPWKTWAGWQPLVRKAQERFESQIDKRSVKLWEKRDVTVQELLEAVGSDPRIWYPVERRLREFKSDHDRQLMLAAIREGAEGPRASSFRALGSQKDDRILEWADHALSDHEPERVRNCARAGLVRLGTPASLEWARARASRTDLRGRAATEVLAKHGDESDVPALLEVFERARSEVDIDLLCELADAFARLKDQRGMPLLEATFKDAVYSYLRQRCAVALAATSPTYSSGLAVESLWDCESVTREAGAKAVDLRADGVLDRLQQLATDVVEAEEVRAAASNRL